MYPPMSSVCGPARSGGSIMIGRTSPKRVKRVKARMDQRTRERFPALESFAKAAADRHRLSCLGALLACLRAAPSPSATRCSSAP